MNAYKFVDVPACIGRSGHVASVTSPVRVPDRIVRSMPFQDKDTETAPLADSFARTEFVRSGLLTPVEAATANFSYVAI